MGEGARCLPVRNLFAPGCNHIWWNQIQLAWTMAGGPVTFHLIQINQGLFPQNICIHQCNKFTQGLNLFIFFVIVIWLNILWRWMYMWIRSFGNNQILSDEWLPLTSTDFHIYLVNRFPVIPEFGIDIGGFERYKRQLEKFWRSVIICELQLKLVTWLVTVDRTY